MTAVTYSDARRNFAGVMKRVCDDHAPTIVTRRQGESVVMLSLSDYEALLETAHLLRNPTNARRLLESIEQLANGDGREHELVP